MKKIFLTIICFQTAFLFSQTPAIQWQKSLGGTLNDTGLNLQPTADGGYVMVGYSQSNDGDVTGNNGDWDYWIVKLDINRNVTWQKSYGGTGDDRARYIEQTADGGYIVAGKSNSTNGNVTGNHGGDDCWVIKLDGNGNIMWQKTYGGSADDDANIITQTADGGYILGGYSASIDGDLAGRTAGNTQDCWIVKLTASGNITWQKNYGGNSLERTASIQQTPDGGYIIGAHASSNNGDVIGNHGGWDYWILKLDTNGNLTWQKSHGGTGTDILEDIQLTTDGGYISTGRSNSNNGDITGNHGSHDWWVVKMDVLGNITWQKSFGGTLIEYGYSIKQTTDGGFIAAGSSSSTDGDLTGNNGVSDAWIVKLSTTGTIEWKKSFGGNGGDELFSIYQTSTNQYLVGGYSASTNGDVTGNQGLNDYWIVKLADCSPVTNSITETACSSFTWTNGNGQTYNASTTATHTIVGGAASGCDSIVTLNLTIGDAVAPVANTATLANVTGQCSVTSLTAPTATDNCAGTITGTHNTTLPITTPGTTVVTWTYNDGNGNTATQTQQVIVTVPVATTTLSGLTISATTSGATYQWINCGNGNTPIAGATSQSYTATANGTYAVIVTQNGCSSTSACVAISTVGLDEFAQALFTVYPNPNNGTFVVTTELPTTITITNAAGQLISTHPLKSGENTIELSHVESGVYFISAIHPNGQTVIQRVSVF